MSKKALELEARNIMQGLEEFATFMSFNCDLAGIRILSVETVDRENEHSSHSKKARIIALPLKRSSAKNGHGQRLYKSLSFQSSRS